MFLLAHAIALLNEAILTKKLTVTFRSNKLILNLLKILVQNNYISSFTIKNSIGLKSAVTVFFYLNNNTFNSIKLVSTSSSYVHIKYKKLNKFFKNNSATLILATDIGLLTSQEALLNKKGGVVICSIN